jgi:predicted GIY-YIG superfamily endonuclease
MKLHVEWSRPIVLRAIRKQLGYTFDLDEVTTRPGVYIFGRQYGSGFEALYIGKSMNVQRRMRSHLNSLRLMQHLRTARSGQRVLLVGEYVTKGGQRVEKCLALSERALIRYFLSEGHDLVNMQGTRIRRHELESTGRHPKRFFPSLMYLERTRRD